MVRNWRTLLVDTLTIGTVIIYPTRQALAQNITTDGTVGTPQILRGPNYNIPQSLGQKVNNNLFHSFGKFNLDSNEAAIFQSGNEINNIFSRVTGGSPSSINGLIRTLGQNVNLFFLNPSGIIFGENASLDVSGSFLATTADSFVFGDGLEFSATNPQAAPLLTVNFTPGLQYGENNPAGTIINKGNLTAGQNLELLTGNLDLQGQLQAGKDLILQADAIKIRDSLNNPFIGAAGNQLLIQGNESVDIFALNHPDSGLFSGKDMILSSANPVVGDIHFWSGGNFEIKRLDVSKGDLFSSYGSIIRSQGDVSFDSYEGASLHIFAGGNVNIPGTVNITSISETPDLMIEAITISNGSTILIDGDAEPTLDIRAGTKSEVTPDNTTVTTTKPPSIFENATSADITVGKILVSNGTYGGKVFLTNQYHPNPMICGNITVGLADIIDDIAIDATDDLGGGSVTLDSRGGIILNGEVNVSAFSESNTFFDGNGGDVTLLSVNDIILNSNSNILSGGLLGGNITFNSNGDILIADSNIQTVSFTNQSNLTGGDINITARSIFVTEGASLGNITVGGANTGRFTMLAKEKISLDGKGFLSVVGNQVQSEATGDSGDIKIEAEQLLITNGGQISASTFGDGDAGDLMVRAKLVKLIGRTEDDEFPSGLFVNSESTGDAGNLSIKADSLFVDNGARVSSNTFGDGNAGNLNIETGHLSITKGAQVGVNTFGNGKAGNLNLISSEVEVIGESDDGRFGSSLGAGVEESATGNGGNLTIETEQLLVAEGAQISAGTFGDGNAGDLLVKAKLVEVIGRSKLFPNDFRSGLFVQSEASGKGNAGNLTIETEHLLVADGAIVSSATLGDGNAGDLLVKAKLVEVISESSNVSNVNFPSGVITLSNNGIGNAGNLTIETEHLLLANQSAVSATTRGSGKAGQITIIAKSLEANNGGQLRTSTSGKNPAGDIQLKIFDNLTLVGADSGIFANTQEGSSGNGGNILIQNQTPQTVIVKDGATIAVNSDGSGQGGSITLAAEKLTLDNGSITAETASNQGGNITLNIEDILSFENIGEITTTAGTAQAGGDGGNVTINADFILAFPTDNTYQIIAEAFEGNGGNIEITTNSFFGREFVDISASSEEGLEGDVSIDILEIDPTKGLTELPANIIDASQQITQGCTPQESGRFVATGRGGLPLSSNEPLRGTAVITNWVDEPRETTGKVNNQLAPTLAEDKSNSKIVEAQKWIINARGNLELITETAANPTIPINIPCNNY